MGNQIEPLPAFASKAEGHTFWKSHDSTGYVDWDGAQLAVFPNLRTAAEAATAD